LGEEHRVHGAERKGHGTRNGEQKAKEREGDWEKRRRVD